jgi:hypothetical protein
VKIAGGLASPIVYRKGKEPQKTYMPGVPFDVDDAEGQAMIAAGVAREVAVVTQEVVVPVETDEAPKKPKEPKKPKAEE